MIAHKVEAESASRQRPPPSTVKLVLPVWGHRYVAEFLEFGLPSLHAPGNIPALAEAVSCQFHVMTSAADVPMFAEHPAWQRLQSICHVTVELIDELITGDNHTTTITLAYSRAVRAVGPQMVDTCFINLCADLVYSDGALKNVLKLMNAGVSAVLGGNFQMVAEDGLPALRRMLDPTRAELVLTSRELTRCGLAHLHPATFANIVNFGLFHNEHTNRLFWRVDDNTLIGRFYLLHVVCVRPEVTEFTTGSSFDYSFIPELCPSNNVVVITDSDDYLMLEIQPRGHEGRHLRQGPMVKADLAISLLEWTTARHRQNVQATLIFHADDIPAAAAKVATDADTYINQVTALLTAPPQPHRNHPYWIGAIMAHRRARGQSEFDAAEFDPRPDRRDGAPAFLWQLWILVYGSLPNFGVCHPYWPDFRLPLNRLEEALAQNKEALIVSPTPDAYSGWLATRSRTAVKMGSKLLLNMAEIHYNALLEKFDVCLMHLTERDLEVGDVFIGRIAPLLRSEGVLYLLISNHGMEELREFKGSFAFHSTRFGNIGLWLTGIHYISTGRLRSSVQSRIVKMGHLAQNQPVLGLPLAALFGPLLLLANYLCNRRVARGLAAPAANGYHSSVFMEMCRSPRREQTAIRPAPGTANADS